MTKRGVLIGCGYISHRQLTAWQQIDEAEIVAVCDLEAEKARQRAREFDIPHVYTDYEQMLDEQAPDFVDIATRPSTHLLLTRAAAERGIAVLCQKPIADDVEEARRIVRVCEAAGVPLMINENTRHQPWFRKAKEIIESGALGELFYARFENRSRGSFQSPPFASQPYFVDMPRLMIFEMDVHFLDTARYLFADQLGEATSVYARIRRVNPDIAGEDFALIVANFGDFTCTVDSSWASVTPPHEGVTWGPFQVEGSAGTLTLDYGGTLTLYTDDDEQSWQFGEGGVLQSFVATQRHFIDGLGSGGDFETSGPETLKTMALVFGAYESAEAGQVVAVDGS